MLKELSGRSELEDRDSRVGGERVAAGDLGDFIVFELDEGEKKKRREYQR